MILPETYPVVEIPQPCILKNKEQSPSWRNDQIDWKAKVIYDDL